MSKSTPQPPPPAKPHPSECCGRGCDPCIFDYYQKALQKWESTTRNTK